jgi:hypothetical protein
MRTLEDLTGTLLGTDKDLRTLGVRSAPETTCIFIIVILPVVLHTRRVSSRYRYPPLSYPIPVSSFVFYVKHPISLLLYLQYMRTSTTTHNKFTSDNSFVPSTSQWPRGSKPFGIRAFFSESRFFLSYPDPTANFKEKQSFTKYFAKISVDC